MSTKQSRKLIQQALFGQLANCIEPHLVRAQLGMLRECLLPCSSTSLQNRVQGRVVRFPRACIPSGSHESPQALSATLPAPERLGWARNNNATSTIMNRQHHDRHHDAAPIPSAPMCMLLAGHCITRHSEPYVCHASLPPSQSRDQRAFRYELRSTNHIMTSVLVLCTEPAMSFI